MSSTHQSRFASLESTHDTLSTDDISVIDALRRRTVLKMLLAGGGALAWPIGIGHAQGKTTTLRIAMTLSDIPVTTGQASGGAEGGRFLNRSIYNAMLDWDLSQADRPSTLIPGLAESWSVDPKDKNLWTFKLRPGVKYHDGSTFTAHDVVWNFDKLTKPKSPQYDRLQARNAANWMASVGSYRALDDHTVEIRTKKPNGTLLYEVGVNVFYSSPRQWEKLGRDWKKFAFEPSGTGPYKMVRLVPRNRAEFVRNPDHWNKDMIPHHERMVLRPMPDANTRVSALLSGQVDLVEALPPDAVPRVKAAGMQVATNVYPHIWPYMISHLPNSPFSDIRIRKAANLAIDRENLVKFLGGLAVPAQGFVTPDHPWFGKPSFKVRYDPDAARKLLSDAGFGKSNPVKIKVTMSAAGSGQMQPLPMNEFIQENFRDVGIDMSLTTVDWEALRSRRFAGAEGDLNKGVDAINYSWSVQYPVFGLIGQTYHSPNRVKGYNWGHFSDAKADQLARACLDAFDADEQNRRLGDLHSYLVDQAVWIWVVHDKNPRGLAAHVKGFVQAQNWFQDFTKIRIEKS